MDPECSYCSANAGSQLSLCTLVVLLIVCIRFPFRKTAALLALSICLMGDGFIISMIVVCSLYYLFHLASLILIQALMIGLWYNNMIVWEIGHVSNTEIV